MKERLLEKLRRLAVSRPVFDPGVFSDAVAEKTDWTPLKPGGTNFATHRLLREGDRLEFKISPGARIFSLVFLLSGLGLVAGFVVPMISREPFSFREQDIGGLVGVVFAVVGWFLHRHFNRPVVFDRRSGYFWKGRIPPDQLVSREARKDSCPLKEIHALQVIAERVRGDKSSYWSYELNLVLKDGRRLNVVDHGSIEVIRTDAAAAADFLQVPLWDAARQA
ncbi:MAG: hypothetical protein P9M08_11145 [Candidatus Erginobacter occultus]|nr:hypothetical protein [Candidatus Erginobacter occultus]